MGLLTYSLFVSKHKSFVGLLLKRNNASACDPVFGSHA